MNQQKLLRQVIGMMLVTLLLVGGCAPAATPTPVPPTATPTPVPPTATPIVAMTIVDRDGEAQEIANWRIEEGWGRNIGPVTSPSWIGYLEIYTNHRTVEIPFDKIEKLDKTTDNIFAVTLVSGEVLEGKLGKYYDGRFHSILLLKGNTTMAGYASEWEIATANITSVAFTLDSQGVISATVSAEDSSTMQVSGPKLQRERPSSFGGTSPTEIIRFTMGDSTLELPLEDIDKILFEEDEAVLILRNGDELRGYFAGIHPYISGETTLVGLPAFFHAQLSDNNFKSVDFP